jgi:flavin-dependent dehydrogenase
VPADAPARFKGHAYLLYSHAKRPVVGDGVLIIGDAAGLAYPESGEGIRPAIESGLMAAQIIAAARGDYSKQRLSEYETNLSARFGERGTGSLASSLPESWKLALARSLMQTQWFTRNVVLNRWFLHADTAPLRA